MSKNINTLIRELFGDKIIVQYSGSVPVILTPTKNSGLDNASTAIAFWRDKKDQIQSLLQEYGAVLLRGFGFTETSHFAGVIENWPNHQLGYTGGGTPRASVKGRVMESTRLPPEFNLPLHQEMAYLPHYPAYLAFYCRVAPAEGGETPIGNMRQLTTLVPDEIRDQVKSHGLEHVRWFPNENQRPQHGENEFLEQSWQQAFNTEDKQEVEQACTKAGIEYRWGGDDSLHTRVVVPGYVSHPQTKENIWFNSLHIMAPSPKLLGEENYNVVLKKRARSEPVVSDTFYGNGEPIPAEHIQEMQKLYEQIKISTPWQVGDVLFLDNYFTAHGRNAFTGARDIQVALLA